MKDGIYLDHAATTDVYPEVQSLVGELVSRCLGNPSSVHRQGTEARLLVDRARIDIAQYFGVQPTSVLFTSGATESIHLAVVGGWLKLKNSKIEKLKKKILVSPIAHSCVRRAVGFLVDHFGVEREDMPLQKSGLFDFDRLESFDFSDFDMVVVEHGNSEIGVLQEIERLGDLLTRGDHKPLYVVDTVASLVSCPSVFELKSQSGKPDFICISGEKIGGIAGSGALVQLSEKALMGLQRGSQEFGLRGGTENVLGICALAKALKLHYQNKEVIRDHFYELSSYADYLFGKQISQMNRIASEMNISHVMVYLLPEGMKSDLFVTQCDMKGLCISAGSACSSGTVGGNKALEALGMSVEESQRAIRLSFGRDTMKKDIEQTFGIIESLLG